MVSKDLNCFYATYLIILSCLICASQETDSEDQITAVIDPMASFYVRQEAALRKLDTLIVKVGMIDILETKLTDLSMLLEDQKEDNKMLKAKLDALESKLENMSSEFKQVNVSVGMAVTSITQIEENLAKNYPNKSEENPDIVDMISNVTEFSQKVITDYSDNLTLISTQAMEKIKAYANEVILNTTTVAPEPQTNNSTSLISEFDDRFTYLEDLLESNTNVTKHLFSATFSRIRVSNLAMDKRLAALLHTSSMHQRLLQDSLMTSLTSVASLVKTQTQDVIRKTESSFESLELSLASTAKRHAKELATLVLEAANYSLSDVSSSTVAQVEELLQMHLNQSAVLEDTLELLKDFKNQTLKYDIDNQVDEPCIVLIGNQTDNSSVVDLDGRAFSHLEDSINTVQFALSEQLAAVSEQLVGMRIYYSTSLHMNTEQVMSSISDVKSELSEEIQDSIAKSTLHLEKLKRSSLSLLDGAVTSVSSSAVASAQNTADQLKDVLTSLEQKISYKLDKLQSTMSQAKVVCPPNYTRVGTICLMTFKDARTSWYTARDLCQQEDGDLAIIPDDHDMLNHLKAFLYSTHSEDDSIAPPPYWLGGKKINGHWTWTDGSSVEMDIEGLEEESQDLDVPYHFDDAEECLMSHGVGVQIVFGPCPSLRGVLCQHSSQQSSEIPQSNSLIPDLLPLPTKRQPLVVIDPALTNDLNGDTGDYYSYLHK